MVIKINLVKILIKLTLEDRKWIGYLKLRPKFFIHECLIVSNIKWHFDSDCSKQVNEDEYLFSFFTPKREFLSPNKEKIIGIGIVGKFLNLTWEKALLVDGLKHNLLSINQLCYKVNNVTFDSLTFRVIKLKSNQTIFTSSRSGNIYTVTLNKICSNDVYLLSNDDWNYVLLQERCQTQYVRQYMCQY